MRCPFDCHSFYDITLINCSTSPSVAFLDISLGILLHPLHIGHMSSSHTACTSSCKATYHRFTLGQSALCNVLQKKKKSVKKNGNFCFDYESGFIILTISSFFLLFFIRSACTYPQKLPVSCCQWYFPSISNFAVFFCFKPVSCLK